MSSNKKSQREREVVSNSPPPSAVDFLFRTMIEREGAPGKRKIRPKNVEDLLQADIQEAGSDEDPDFDYDFTKDKHKDESDISIGSDEEDEDTDDQASSKQGKLDDSDDDESDDSYKANIDDDDRTSDSRKGDTSSDSEEISDKDDMSPTPKQKKSALRETLQKLNDAEEFAPQKRKRKRPKKATGSTSAASRGKSLTASKKGEDSKTKSRSPAKSKANDSKSKPSGSKKTRKVISIKGKSRIKEPANPKTSKRKRLAREGGGGSIFEMINNSEKSQKENRKEIQLGNPICSACLGNKSDGSNEIVECDSCGITVHEGCYGVSDTLSVSSGSGSSCSTEPWFCDACKTGAKSISCELCPVKGGLFKETTAGRWVHLVCALYTPGVVIVENGLPSLFDIPYSKWGAYPCSVCESERYARTGVCVQCDAGMCKTYLHATCAQKHGLLSEPNDASDATEADPFYAACKLHTNREIAKRRAKNCGILQEQLRIKKELKRVENQTPQERMNQSRIRRKLERIRFKVAIKQAHSYSQHTRKPSLSSSYTLSNPNGFSVSPSSTPVYNFLPFNWNESQKKSRMLSTSAGTTGAFIRKAELMGLNVKSLELEDKHDRIVASVSRKWNILPALSVEFAAYYADREIRVNKLSEQCEKLDKLNNELNSRQTVFQSSYDTHCVNHMAMEEDTTRVRKELSGLSRVLKQICPPQNKKLLSTLATFVKAEASMQRKRSPSYSKSKNSPLKIAFSKKNNKKGRLLMSPPPIPVSAGRLALALCSLCKKSDEQHMITRCDHCKLHYHLKCLDPPLTRMPKRSRLCGWMCSDCGEEEPEEEDSNVDTEAPRSLRGRTKIRKPGKYRFSSESGEEEIKLLTEILNPSPVVERKQIASSPSLITLPIQIKMENSASMVLTNGDVRGRKRRRSGSNSTTSANSIKLSSLPSQRFPQDKSPVIENKVDSKQESFKTPTAKSDKKRPKGERKSKSPVKIVEPETEPKPKKKKTKKIKEDSKEKLQEDNPVEVEVKPKKVRKPRQKKSDSVLSKSDSVLDKPDSVLDIAVPEGLNETPAPKKKIKRKKKEAATPTVADKSPENPTSSISPTKPTSSISPAKPTTEPLPEKPLKKKRQRKPKGELKKENPAVESQDIVLINAVQNMVSPPVVFGDLGNVFESPVNGPAKIKSKAKKRKSSSASTLGVVVPPASTTLDTESSPPTKEKTIPPKKRKTLPASTPEELNNQLAIIEAVANGLVVEVEGDVPFKNGISKPLVANEAVVSPKVSPMEKEKGVTDQWSNNANDHSIMKGHAMGSNCQEDEIVTVNASDLIDCVVNSTSESVTTYSPGFYSTPSVATTSQNYVSIPNPLSHGNSIKFSTPKDPPNNTAVVGATAPAWCATSSQDSQNVIKLHYESNTVVNVAAPYAAPAIPASYTPSLDANSSIIDGKCANCEKDDSKSKMVTCDKCAQDFHFMCLNPPLKYSPRRRGYSWFCSGCDDDDSTTSGQENGLNSP